MPFEARVEIKGLGELVRRMGGVGRRSEEGMRRVLGEGLLLIGGELGEYPAAIPGSRYVRTGLLGRQWGAARPVIWRHSVGALRGRIVNRRPGVVSVQKGGEQASVHRGRWRTAEEVIEEKGEELDRILGVEGTGLVEWMAGNHGFR